MYELISLDLYMSIKYCCLFLNQKLTAKVKYSLHFVKDGETNIREIPGMYEKKDQCLFSGFTVHLYTLYLFVQFGMPISCRDQESKKKTQRRKDKEGSKGIKDI